MDTINTAVRSIQVFVNMDISQCWIASSVKNPNNVKGKLKKMPIKRRFLITKTRIVSNLFPLTSLGSSVGIIHPILFINNIVS